VKLPAGKILIPGVVSHSTDLVEHPELLADRIITFAEIVGRETSSPAPTAAWAAASIRRSPGPSSAPYAKARQSRAKTSCVEFQKSCAGMKEMKKPLFGLKTRL